VRCIDPGHRDLVAIHASCGPSLLGSLGFTRKL